MSEAKAGTVLVNMVAMNMSKKTDADYEYTILARKLQIILGWPSSRDLQAMLETKLLPNCLVTQQGVAMVDHIFGPDVG
jgi:hypothetical protein